MPRTPGELADTLEHVARWRGMSSEEANALLASAVHLRETDERIKLDAINIRYEIASNAVTLASAVETALEQNQPDIKGFEGLVRTLQAFDSRIQLPLQER